MPVRMALLVAVLCLGHEVATGCQLLGASFSEAVQADHLFRAFRRRGNACRDGWGIGFYSDRYVTLFKEADNAASSELARFVATHKRDPLVRTPVRRIGRQGSPDGGQIRHVESPRRGLYEGIKCDTLDELPETTVGL